MIACEVSDSQYNSEATAVCRMRPETKNAALHLITRNTRPSKLEVKNLMLNVGCS